MERVDAPVPVVETEAPAVPGLGSMVGALTSTGSPPAELTPRVVAWLESAPASEANAKELLALLDGDAFAGLSGPDGRPLKVAALLALLRMGYPWALQVRPEDLAWLRTQERPFWRRNVKEIIAVALWVALAIEVAVVTAPWWW
jgi:hypothetical protein